MVKVYVNYIKLKGEKYPVIYATTTKEESDRRKSVHEQINKQSPGYVLKNKVKTVTF